MRMGLSQTVGKKWRIFIVGPSPHSLCLSLSLSLSLSLCLSLSLYLPPPALSPLRNTIFNCIHPSRITAPFYSYNLDRACTREGAGRTLLIIEPRTGAGERRARGRNTDIPACFLASMHYNASTMHRCGIHQSYDYVSDYERHSDTGRLLLVALSIRHIDHQITHYSALEKCSKHLYVRCLLM